MATDKENMEDQQRHVLINVRYGLDAGARKVFAIQMGSLDPNATPPMPAFPGLAYVPMKGDLVQWSAIGNEHTFIVNERVFRFSEDGQIEILLMIGLCPNPAQD